MPDLLGRLTDLLNDLLPEGRRTGGPLGTPSYDPDEAPPGLDQETNRAVSGGGMVGRDEHPAQHRAHRSRV